MPADCNWIRGSTPVRSRHFEWCVDAAGALNLRSRQGQFHMTAEELVRLHDYLLEQPRRLGNNKDGRPATVPLGDAIGWDFIVDSLGRTGCHMWASHLIGVLLEAGLLVQHNGRRGFRAYQARPELCWQTALTAYSLRPAESSAETAFATV